MARQRVLQSLLGRRRRKASDISNNQKPSNVFLISYFSIGKLGNKRLNDMIHTANNFPTQEEMRYFINQIKEINKCSYVLISNVIPLETF